MTQSSADRIKNLDELYMVPKSQFADTKVKQSPTSNKSFVVSLIKKMKSEM